MCVLYEKDCNKKGKRCDDQEEIFWHGFLLSISYITFTYSSFDVSRAALIKIWSDKTSLVDDNTDSSPLLEETENRLTAII